MSLCGQCDVPASNPVTMKKKMLLDQVNQKIWLDLMQVTEIYPCFLLLLINLFFSFLAGHNIRTALSWYNTSLMQASGEKSRGWENKASGLRETEKPNTAPKSSRHDNNCHSHLRLFRHKRCNCTVQRVHFSLVRLKNDPYYYWI